MNDFGIITVTLNPAVDKLVHAQGMALGAHCRCRTVSNIAGGKGVNVSRVLSSMRIPSIATGFLGSENRAVFRETFTHAGIADEFITLDGSTRENITLVDPDSGAEIHLRDVGLKVNDRQLEKLREKLKFLVKPGDMVIFSGSLPPGISPAQQASLIEMCISAGGKVVVDTSGPALREAAKLDLYLAKPNKAELCELLDIGCVDINDVISASEMLLNNIGSLLLSDGANGAYLVTRESVFFAPTPRVEVVNTVGCGDTVLGAFMAAVVTGKSPEDSLRWAVACAAASAASESTAVFDNELAEKLFDEIKVKKQAIDNRQ